MRYRRETRDLIEKSITQYVARGLENDSSWILDGSINGLCRGRDMLFNLDNEKASLEVLSVAGLSLGKKKNRKIRTLVLTPNRDSLKKIKEVCQRLQGNSPLIVFLDQEEAQKEIHQFRKTPHFTAGSAGRIIDHIRRENLDLSGVQQVIFDAHNKEGDWDGFEKDISFIFTRVSDKVRKLLFVSDDETATRFLPLLRRPITVVNRKRDMDQLDKSQKELQGMSNILTDKMQSDIENLIIQVKEKEEPDTLNEYRKMFKKTVPFAMRSWVSAYLFKEAIGSGGGGQRSRKPVKNAKIVPIEGGVSLFVGVGKKRRIYPKDIIQLFITKGGAERSDIGEVKILDSYSFVNVKENVADKLIKNMNGLTFRGRKLNVNYAKKKA